MCGRLACGLQPQEICNSCYYKQQGSSNYTIPQWKNFHNLGKIYKPSYNICPKEVAPVLLSGSHFKSNSRIVAPMVFGVIPHWSKPNDSLKYSTINCRIETIQTSKLYGNLLQKGQRCVVICSGYYEWQKQSNGKIPYFIHAQQPEGVEVGDPDSWNLYYPPTKNPSGFQPLRLAALFEVSSSELKNQIMLSFTIITREANSDTSWLHKRMPAILESNQQVDAWLNYEEIDADHALQYIFQKVCITWTPASNSVNKVTNKDISCIKQENNSEQSIQNQKYETSSKLLKNWLEKGQKRKTDESKGSIDEKIKKEEI